MTTGNSNISGEHATINCPKCSHEITYYDVENSSYYVCPGCLAFFEYEHENNPWVITGFSDGEIVSPHIPLGTEGVFDGLTWRVIGFMVKQEEGDSARWREYILHRKGDVYVTLAEYNGHWMLVKTAPRQTYESKKRAYKDYYVDASDGTYDLYHSYKFEIVYARGEFDWNIMNDSGNVIVFEYIAPPSIIIQEELDNKSTWYKGKYKEPHEIAQAFNLTTADLPRKRGLGAIQPTTFYDHFPFLMRTAIVFSVLVIVTQILLSIAKPQKTLVDIPVLIERDTSSTLIAGAIKPIVSPSFKIDGPAMLNIEFSAAVDNDWMELPATLVNEKDGSSYELTRVIEYYHGYSEGENWSEGGQTSDANLNNIPSGTYHINIYPYSNTQVPPNAAVKVVQNEPLYSNVFLMILVVISYPIIMIWRKKHLENTRWGYD